MCRWLCPFPYREAIVAQAARTGLDPLLVAAVIKVESDFEPGAESPRGARGLMQVMPNTADSVARELGMAYNPSNLFDPNYNLRLGTWYLADLCREYDGDLVPALAAYNGGRSQVDKWLASRQWTGEIEEIGQIPFPETRRYVVQVLNTYQTYRRLYGES